jgi:acetolactate synthase-1/2/3 large subunit
MESMTVAPSRTGGQILVDQLVAQGVDHLFCVPGESYLAVLDALHDADIAVTVCRQESGAAMMAEAHGKLSGRPGICFVTRGPGATNASAGIHVAHQDSTPMILFVGQVERGFRGREAFQELDYPAVFGSMAKWVVEVDTAERLPEIVARAFAVAMAGRPGPVVVALPEDMLVDMADVDDAPRAEAAEIAPDPTRMAEIAAALAAAERPIAILGGARWSGETITRLAAWAERINLPVATSFRRQMLFPADHPCYAGDVGIGINPALLERIQGSDLILLIGGRLSEMPSQSYTLLDVPTPRQPLVHVHPDPEELGRVYRAAYPVAATPDAFVAALEAFAPAPFAADAVEQAHAAYRGWSDLGPISLPGDVQAAHAMRTLIDTLPADTIVCNGAGNFATWIHRFWPFRHYGTQLAPTSGSMGYGLPAGVAAQRVSPGRRVLVLAGDGDFMMTCQEFATAVQYDLPILVVLLDNGMYGTIRMHQEREYPGRPSATALRNPDFRALAIACGGHGERVETDADFAPALERALASGKPALLHCLIDPEALTPTRTLSDFRRMGEAKRAAE